MIEITMYKVNCINGCGKTRLLNNKWDRFMCKGCKDGLKEPAVSDFNNAQSLCNAIDYYQEWSKKDSTYDYDNEIEKLAKSTSEIPEEYKNKCWDLAREMGDYHMGDTLSEFEKLEDIFKI